MMAVMLYHTTSERTKADQERVLSDRMIVRDMRKAP